jgi:hypothetical protein
MCSWLPRYRFPGFGARTRIGFGDGVSVGELCFRSADVSAPARPDSGTGQPDGRESGVAGGEVRTLGLGRAEPQAATLVPTVVGTSAPLPVGAAPIPLGGR